jgi:hypothetical protein
MASALQPVVVSALPIRQKVGSLSTEELLEYRKEKSRYFKSWYLNKKLKEGWTPKPPKTVAPKTEEATEPNDFTFNFTD